MSNQPVPTLKDSLSTMISSALSAVKANRLDNACDWANQAVQATSASDDIGLRTQVNSIISVILMKAAVGTRTAALRSGNIYAALDSNVQVIVRCADLLNTMAAAKDRGIGQALALVIGGFGKQLSAAIEPHKGASYVHTTGPMLDDFLTTTGSLIKAISTYATGASVDEPEGISQAERMKQVETAVSNANALLSTIFPKALSDFDKARVFCRHAFALIADSHARLKPQFDAIDSALAASSVPRSRPMLVKLLADLSQ